MGESALFKSYRDTEKKRLRQQADEALAQVAAEEAAHTGEKFGPPSPQPGQIPQPAQPRGFVQGLADALLPGDPRPEKNATGVMGSITRGLRAIPDRFGEGVHQMLNPGEAEAQNPSRTLLQGAAQSKPIQVALGVLNAVFPFSAFAGETGGDFGEWLARYSGELTDDRLKQARAQAIERESKHGTDPSAPDGSRTLDAMLGVSYEQRVAQARMAASVSAEMLAGTVPGYTSTNKPPKRPSR